MTTIHSASINAGATTAALTVTALDPHGLMASVDCRVYCVIDSTNYEVARARAGETKVFYPLSDELVIENLSEAAGAVHITAA